MTGRKIALLGVPYDEQSSYRRGAAKAPPLIREAWFSPSANLYSEDGTLVDREFVEDLGDLEFPPGTKAFDTIERGADDTLARGYRPIFLGGDHSISYPIMKAFSRHHRPSILQIDAHPDIYDSYEGNRLSHACPFARIMQEGLAEKLVQVGVRTLTASQRAQAKKFDVEIHDMASFRDDLEMDVTGPLYVSLDIDALDPAFAPGISHREPGGLSTRQVINIIQSIRSDVVGADIVEFNPDADVSGMTGMVCAKLLKEIASRIGR
jgi:agmatinase